jgi:hypothetical protein
MKQRRKIVDQLPALCARLFPGCQRRDASSHRPASSAATLEEVLYLSSPKVLKRASLGYDGLLADIYWTRAVQYFGFRHHNFASDSYNLLAPLLEITTHTRSASHGGLRIWRQLSGSAAAEWRGPTRARDSVDGIRHSEQSRQLEALLRPGLRLLHES